MAFFLILLFICFYCFGRPSLERFLANTVSLEESVEENEKLRPPVIRVAKCQIFYTELIKKSYDCYPKSKNLKIVIIVKMMNYISKCNV